MFIKLALTMMFIACALYDLIEFRIPNVLTGAIALMFPIWVVAHHLTFMEVGDHLFVGIAVLVCTAILFRFRLLGGGDVKLLSGTCLWAGPYLFLAHLAVTSFFAVGVLLLIHFVRRAYPVVLATVPRIGAVPMPRVLQPGAGVPYGIAIAASAIVLGIPRTF